MKNLTIVSMSLILCLIFVLPGRAADGRPVKLDQIVVTAAKHETFVKDVPAAVTIIDSDQIASRNLPNGDIGDVLRSVPGITLRRAYAPFPAYPNIRGMGSDSTIVLVNGIPTNWEISQAIPPGNIQRIEVVRGPASALYGANGSGGVINIILKKGKREKSGRLGLGYGRFDTRRLNGDTQGSFNGFGYALAASYEDSNGSRTVTNQVNPSITMIDECEYDKKAFSVNTAYDVNENAEVSLFYHYFNDRYTRGRPHVGGDWDRHFTAVSWEHDFSGRLSFRAYAGLRYDDLLHLYDKGNTNYEPNRKRYTDYYETPVELRLTADAGAGNTVTAGLFYNRQETEQDYRMWTTNAPWRLNRYKVRTLAGYVQDVWKPVEPLTVMAGFRYDHWENYGNYFSAFTDSNPGDRTDDNFSPKLGIRYHLTDDMSVWANYGVGFKPPTPTQLYDDRTSGGNSRLPNPDLKPEKTQSGEIGVEKWFGDVVQVNLAGFYSYTDDKILSWFDADNVWVNKNIGGSESYGVEFSAAWYLSENWILNADYTYNEATIDENPANPSQEGNDLPFSPRHKANLSLSYKKPGKYSISLSARYLSDQYTNDDNITQDGGESLLMAESSVFDVKAVKHVPISRGWVKQMDIALCVDNVFDEDYRTFYMYEDPGTVVSLDVSLKF